MPRTWFTSAGLAIPIVALLVGLGTAGRAADVARVVSPDEAVLCRVALHDGRLTCAVTFKGRPVIEPSPLALTVDSVDLTSDIAIGEARAYQIKESYPYRGVHARAVNHCNGVTIPLKHPKGGGTSTLEIRAFNDGVAYRHVVPGDKEARVPDEATRFILPAGCTVWYHDLEGHYEGVHVKKALADVKEGEWAAAPLTIRLPEGTGYAAITEAAVVNYSAAALRADGRGGFRLVLGHAQPPSYPFRLRYKDDIERLARPATVTGTITTPWRVVLVGADLNTLVNSDVISNLCPPPDPKLFPKGMATEWAKPGRAVWRYLDGGETTLDGMKEFNRLAGELGFEYHIIEGFWRRWSDAELRDLVAHGKKHGVGLILWKHSRELREPTARQAFFKKCQDAGVAGAKIDFFDHDHKEVMDLYPLMLREAAEHRLVVNFHGSAKPAGEPRTWPNELVRESIKGMESSKLVARARHDATVPFTRFLAGHGEYTVTHFGARRGDTTAAHQVATAVVFTAPLLTYASHPQKLLDSPAAPIIKSIPATWDETVVLPASEIGEVAAVARRSGDVWFLAVVNGPSARKLAVPLKFLGGGEFRSQLFQDVSDDPAAIKTEELAVRGDMTLTIDLSAGGGFIGQFRRK